MKRNEFIKTLAGAGLASAVAPASLAFPFASSESNLPQLPNHWIWHRPKAKATDDDLKRQFEDMRSLGFEAVLPQIFSSNKALFNIDGYETETPLLERMIPLAHAAGLQIHAWMWTMPCNNERIIKEHPDWYAVNRNGLPAHTDPAYVGYYKFLCPRKTEVREFVQERVKALASITELDGIHLDYVRLPDSILAEGLQPKYNIVQDQEYPQYDYCYCNTCRSQYKEKMGIDPMKINNPADDEAWYQFRYDAVVGMVNDYLVPTAKAKDKIITAAVFPNWESVRQQWHKFDLDGFLPMLYQGFYNKEIDWIGEETAKALLRLDHNKPIYSGLFSPHLKTADKLAAAVNSADANGAKGFAIFAYNDLSSVQKSALKSIMNNKDK